MKLKETLPSIVTPLPGPNAQAILERRKTSVPSPIQPLYPLVIKRGEGAMVEDYDGNIFLDWIGGVGVLNAGYSDDRLIKAASNQLKKFFHVMMAVGTHEGYVALAEKMNEIVPVKSNCRQTMFVNCGAEAIENAVKIAKGATGRPNIIVYSGAFHGRTNITMAMTAKKKYAVGMGPFPDGIIRAQYPYLYRKPEGLTEDEAIDYFIADLNRVFDECSPSDYIAGIVIEPILGEGGFIPAPIKYIKKLRQICDEKGILLIADEIQCGFGRSGKMFVSEYWSENGCPPDILVCAKSIAGGLPLGAVTAGKELYDRLAPGTIGGTFSGNAVACETALQVIELMKNDNLPDHANKIGKIICSEIREWQNEFKCIGDVRGWGAMIGVEFIKDPKSKSPAPELVNAIMRSAFQKGLIIENAGIYSNVLRFLAPLVMTEQQTYAGLKILKEAIKENI